MKAPFKSGKTMWSMRKVSYGYGVIGWDVVADKTGAVHGDVENLDGNLFAHKKAHQSFDTEAECDAAMDAIKAECDAYEAGA